MQYGKNLAIDWAAGLESCTAGVTWPFDKSLERANPMSPTRNLLSQQAPLAITANSQAAAQANSTWLLRTNQPLPSPTAQRSRAGP